MSKRVGKKQKCSNCGKMGHNKRNCKEKDVDLPEFNINDVEFYDYTNNEDFDLELSMQKEELITKKKRLEHEEIKKTKNKDAKLWYETQDEAIAVIHSELFIKNKKIALVVAEPGVGKTNLIHGLYYLLKTKLCDSKIIIGDRITIATGMSSTDWINQTSSGTQLRDTRTINGSGNSDIKEDIYHNPTFVKRIKYLMKNPDLLTKHVFIIDECHIACEKTNTLDYYLEKLGLNSEIMERLQIKIVLISATPDIVASEFNNKIEKDWQFVKLEPGPNYRGFSYFKNNNNIQDYNKFFKKISEDENKLQSILDTFDTPKYHIIRIRGMGKTNNKLKEIILKLCGKKGYFYRNHNQKERIEDFKEFISGAPEKHTFIFIKDFFRASYRIRLSQYFGLIVEPSSKLKDVTVTAQGLIARFFGYYDESQMRYLKTLFICNISCVNTYIDFTEKFTYEGTNYTSKRLKKGGIAKSGVSTPYNEYAINDDEKIKSREKYDVFPSLEGDKSYNTIDELIKDFDKQFPNKHYTRDHIHPPNTSYTNNKKEEIFTKYWISTKINKGNINTKDKFSKTLQSKTNFDGSIDALIYPIYENNDSAANDIKFYMKYEK